MDSKHGTVNWRKLSKLIAELRAEIDAVEVQALGVLGADPSPVTRTHSPIIGTDPVNTNIDKLDAAIGADPTPVTRTNNPIVVNTSVNAKVDALDAAIGASADLTPVTRTVGQLTDDSTLLAKIEAIDTAIGFDAQMAGAPLDISKSQTIYQNLDALDAKKTLRTIKKTIGNVGVTADFNFSSAANHNEQHIDLGELLPAKCRIVDVVIFTDAAFTNLGALNTTVGFTSGTTELIGAGNNTALNAILATVNSAAFLATPSASAQHVWVNVDPANNWNSANPVGKMTVFISFIDVTNL